MELLEFMIHHFNNEIHIFKGNYRVPCHIPNVLELYYIVFATTI